MKLPAHEHLEARGIPYQALSFPVTTEKGAASVARVLGYRESQMVKTLIFETDRRERVLVMVPGDRSAISGRLKKVIGSRNVRLASLDTVEATTGYDVGSVPPFHWQPEGFRSFIDAALMREDVLGVGAGEWGQEIVISPQDLQRACNGTVANLTERKEPE